MAHLTIAERNFPAGLRRESPGVAIPDQSLHVQASLTSSEWATKAGQGSVFWGVEHLPAGASQWQLLVGTTSQFGYLAKGLYMPSIGFTTGGPAMSGEIRLFATATAAIRLGVEVDVTPEA
jgi:hypothetical protein